MNEKIGPVEFPELAKYNLNQKQKSQFNEYLSTLVEENSKYNLTAIRNPKDIVVKHFADSLEVLEILKKYEIVKIADIGSGAGFPGIPISIMQEKISVVLIESIQKKTNFLEIVKEKLGLKNLSIEQKRVEEERIQEEYFEFFDAITCRATFYLPIFLEMCYNLVRKGGIFIAFKSKKNIEEELDDTKKILARLNLKQISEKEYKVEEDERVMLIFQKNDNKRIKVPDFGKLKYMYRKERVE